MERVAFKMKLHEGQAAAYERRHAAIWPELEQLLKASGISAYSIFLDPETHQLFGVLTVTKQTKLGTLAHEPVMKRWWAYMKDIMECNPDDSPVSMPLKEVFYLP
jgi:L-rhamnose mutarotase